MRPQPLSHLSSCKVVFFLCVCVWLYVHPTRVEAHGDQMRVSDLPSGVTGSHELLNIGAGNICLSGPIKNTLKHKHCSSPGQHYIGGGQRDCLVWFCSQDLSPMGNLRNSKSLTCKPRSVHLLGTLMTQEGTEIIFQRSDVSKAT